jgi:hypothetical protein
MKPRTQHKQLTEQIHAVTADFSSLSELAKYKKLEGMLRAQRNQDTPDPEAEDLLVEAMAEIWENLAEDVQAALDREGPQTWPDGPESSAGFTLADVKR